MQVLSAVNADSTACHAFCIKASSRLLYVVQGIARAIAITGCKYQHHKHRLDLFSWERLQDWLQLIIRSHTKVSVTSQLLDL